jgi:hypothetical protein
MGVQRFIMKKANSFEFFVANGDMDHAPKFFALGSGQIGAADDPVIVTAAIETILFPQTVGKHLSFVILLPWDRVRGFSL